MGWGEALVAQPAQLVPVNHAAPSQACLLYSYAVQEGIDMFSYLMRNRIIFVRSRINDEVSQACTTGDGRHMRCAAPAHGSMHSNSCFAPAQHGDSLRQGLITTSRLIVALTWSCTVLVQGVAEP